MEALEDGNFVFNYTGSTTTYAKTFYYSYDAKEWTKALIGNTSASSSPASTITIPVVAGERVYFCSTQSSLNTENDYIKVGNSSTTVPFNIGGSLASWLSTPTSIGNYCFYSFFKGSPVKSAEDLIFPLAAVGSYAYKEMFSSSSITTLPKEFSALSIGTYACEEMFYNCSSLTKGFESIFANTVSSYGFFRMFCSVIGIKRAPDISITTLGAYGCNSMFYSAYITTIGKINISNIGNNGCSCMFYGCSYLISWEEFENTTVQANGCYSMFAQCTNLSSIPKQLPATNLNNYSYNTMFYNCTSLKEAPEIVAATVKQYTCQGMFQFCTSLEYSPDLPATTGSNNCYWRMFEGCTALKAAPAIALTRAYSYCCYGMFMGCTSLLSTPPLIQKTLAESCFEQMFNGCSSLTGEVEVAGLTAVDCCYFYMFYGCSQLKKITLGLTSLSSSVANPLKNFVGNTSGGEIYCTKEAVKTAVEACVSSSWTVLISEA